MDPFSRKPKKLTFHFRINYAAISELLFSWWQFKFSAFKSTVQQVTCLMNFIYIFIYCKYNSKTKLYSPICSVQREDILSLIWLVTHLPLFPQCKMCTPADHEVTIWKQGLVSCTRLWTVEQEVPFLEYSGQTIESSMMEVQDLILTFPGCHHKLSTRTRAVIEEQPQWSHLTCKYIDQLS